MTTRVKIKEAIEQLNGTFIQREEAVNVVWLALLTGQNFILVGDPGTAKTALVQACYSHITGARVFSTLCGAFATEDKIFGPVDVEAFKRGEWNRSIKGRLADCELGFLDEMLKTNEGTLNGMLTALNERVYEGKRIPLRTCGAATNWPEVNARTDNVAALWDRVLLRCEVKEVGHGMQPKECETARIKMLEAVDAVARYAPKVQLSLAELDAARAEVEAVQVGESVRRSIVATQERLEKQNIRNSSRRFGALQRALRASAWLDNRAAVRLDDFDVLKFGLWANNKDIEKVDAVIEAVDHDVVNQCIMKLKDATKQCRSNPSIQAAPKLIKTASAAAAEASAMLKQFGARSAGRAKIKAEIKALREVYDELKAKVEPHLAKADTGAEAVAEPF
jgi:MoxR-like ATPase